jgi:hypothetical protein
MAGQRQDSVPIAEAATLLGLSQEAVRKRLQRGTLDGEKVAGTWHVLLDRPDTPSGRQDTVRTDRQDSQDAEPVEAAYQVSPAVVEQAIARTGQQYTADLRAMLGELRQVYEGQLAAKDETIAAVRAERDAMVDELRRRAEAAEDEIAAIRTRYELARRGEKESEHRLSDALALQPHPPPVEPSARDEGLRARLGRWWRGEG